jgi:arginyl-tRNA synthetase
LENKIEVLLEDAVKEALVALYAAKIEKIPVVAVQKTRKEFKGDFTVVVFPLLRISSQSPEETAKKLGEHLCENIAEVVGYNVIKGFLNLTLSEAYWEQFFRVALATMDFGNGTFSKGKKVMVEYSSPNTNKPLHLGHLRNNFLGDSIGRIFQANGQEVVRAQIINDRGVHICKSMLAWQKWGGGETPASTGMKGDHLVGKYYVIFDQHYKAEVAELMKEGKTKTEAEQEAPLMKEVRAMLQQWEQGDASTVALWKKMNAWVYEGFNATYQRMGVTFDKLYYESDTFLQGKDEVMNGLAHGVFHQNEDGSIWVDLTKEGLDEKLVLRKDGTSVYMTQDIGTAILRFKEFEGLEGLTYVVGNEQDYHFKALFAILKKLGCTWASSCYHLSYGMVDLPSGKMKSREGTVVDADELIQEMVNTARNTAEALGKLDDFTKEEKTALFEMVGLGALKYFILKVDPKKRMLFDPEESVDFNGNTGPFIQYTYARIQSILRKAKELKISTDTLSELGAEEKNIVQLLHEFPKAVELAGKEMSPSVIANFVYDLVKAYNHYYQTVPILKGEEEPLLALRIQLSELVGRVIQKGMYLLGIDVPSRM